MATYMSRSASLLGFYELVDSLGGDAEALLNEVGIEPDWLRSDDYLLPSDALIHLLELAADRLHCPSFGIELARLQSLDILGPVALLVQQCRTLGEALARLKQFLHVHSQAGIFDYFLEGKQAYLTFEPMVSFSGRSRQLIDLSLVAGLNIVRQLIDEPVQPTSAFFSYREPRDLQAYHSVFHCPLSFEREINGAAVDRQLLDKPLRQDPTHLRGFVNRYVQDLRRDHPMDLEYRLRVLIRQLLPLGQANLAQISQLMQVEVRTLQRRLGEKGTRFQALLNDERKQLAIRYLNESNVSMTHLSELLGFAEQSVFSRSFKHWTGKTPTQYVKAVGARLKYRG